MKKRQGQRMRKREKTRKIKVKKIHTQNDCMQVVLQLYVGSLGKIYFVTSFNVGFKAK